MSDADTEGLPPSARFVLDVLDREGPCSRQTLLTETELPERTLDDALALLQERDMVDKTTNPDDVRQVVYEYRD